MFIYCFQDVHGGYYMEYAVRYYDLFKKLEVTGFRITDEQKALLMDTNLHMEPMVLSQDGGDFDETVTIAAVRPNDVFMDIYRDMDYGMTGLNEDDRVEVFSGILMGSSDFTRELLEEVADNYDVDLGEILGYKKAGSNIQLTEREAKCLLSVI